MPTPPPPRTVTEPLNARHLTDVLCYGGRPFIHPLGGCMSQFRRFSSPKVLKSENQFSNDISIGSVRLCPSRLKLLSMCIINVDKYR